MNDNVSVNQINEIAESVKAAAGKFSDSVSQVSTASSKMEFWTRQLSNINGAIVKGSHNTREISHKNMVGEKTIDTYESYHRCWVINSSRNLEGIIISTAYIINQCNEINDCLSSLFSEAASMQSIADAIDGYIMSVQTELGDNVSTEALSSSFGSILASKLAYDSASAESGNYINRDDILDEYWVDGTLRFEKQENGTYLIYQKDENGNDVAMGFTSAFTAALYMKNLNSAVNPQVVKQDNKENETATEKVSTPLIDAMNNMKEREPIPLTDAIKNMSQKEPVSLIDSMNNTKTMMNKNQTNTSTVEVNTTETISQKQTTPLKSAEDITKEALSEHKPVSPLDNVDASTETTSQDQSTPLIDALNNIQERQPTTINSPATSNIEINNDNTEKMLYDPLDE